MEIMSRAYSMFAASALASSLLLASSAAAETFKYAFQGDVLTMDPHGAFETMTLGFQGNIYDGLVTRNEKMETVGALAESFENIEPRVWRFKLHRGVKFHNGNDFTAEDVEFSVNRIRSEGSDLKVVAGLIQEVRIIDEYTVDLVTPAPDPILPLQLEIFYIMDKEWAEANNVVEVTPIEDGGNFATLNTNGTGPFILEDRQSGVKTVLVRNPVYYGETTGNISRVEFTPIDQDATRVAALISGNVHMAYPIPIQDWKRLEDAVGVRPLTGPEARTIFLGFDQIRDELTGSNVKGKNPFKDVRVRKAFYQAINIQAIKKKVMRGAATPTGLMVAPQINGFAEKQNVRYPYDPEAARQLLSDAGYPDGFELLMDCPNNRYVNDEKICQAVASMLAKVGVKVELLAQPKSKYFGKVTAQNGYDTSFFLLGWTPSTFDSLNVISALMACRGGEDKLGAFNLGGYCNPRINELASKIKSETDQGKRQTMIEEVFQLHHDEVGHIPLHQQPLSWGASEQAEVVQRPDNVFDLRFAIMK